ncbi:hypothetical protein SAMN02745123_03286 [Desulforamulus aeronauticus DSM 10349]|uniref:Uncharacterized protein n=1 Tax=Desulforamulus aeronauticus DSM 10349 TaxID=1121421 RepID=A0A1M6VNY2_9FIRM|nr:hypothetical protein SAMN02745123_03286 [Desulforamulus aeronauticus DSM 10349]
MNALAQEIRRKRLTFTAVFIVLTLLFGLVQWQWEQGNLSEKELQWLLLAWRLLIGVLCLWFGYAVGIHKQTVWFMTMLAVLHQVTSWLALLYFLYKSGVMLIKAKKGATASGQAKDKELLAEGRSLKARKSNKKTKK